jgi:hypothetical protein
MLFYRAFVEGGDIAAAVSGANNPPPPTFVNTSGLQFNTIHANTFPFYEEINTVVQHEPGDAFDPEIVGRFASIGIKRGKPFAPNERMKGILTGAVAVANATALSQDILAEMLGARRPSITNAARELEQAGLIERGRRQIRILDRAGLTKASCECYQLVRERVAFHPPKIYL